MSPKGLPGTCTIGLVSISDRASQGVYPDEGLPSLEDWLRSVLTTPFHIRKELIPDDEMTIRQTLLKLSDVERCHLILTTGGTGPARRDVTPEATRAVGTKELPGFAEQMRQVSLQFVPTAILSRQVAVIREIDDHASLIINLPGRPRAIRETLEGLPDRGVSGIFAAVPYCLDLIGAPRLETDEKIIKSFRPKK